MAFLGSLLTFLLFGLSAVLFPSRAAAAEIAKRQTLTQVTSFGSNPSGTLMYIYVPTNLASKPAIVVAIHYCTGTAEAYYTGTPYATLAEQYGFIVIYPQSPYSGTCWDVSSTAALTHNGGGDSNSIANMVTYTISQYNADASRVFVTGSSSGAMMTNVLAGTYPELFAAATVYSGVPAGCFYTGTVDGWNTSCAEGDIIESQAYWTNVVDNMYPGYTGSRPRMLIFHGTADTTLYPENFNETLKQWTGVFGYTYNPPEQTLYNTPSSVYTEYIFGPDVVGILGAGVGHTVPVNGTEDMEWFGIAGNFFTSTPTGPTSTSTTSKPTSTTTTTTTSPVKTSSTATITSAPTQTQSEWGQCGGSYYSGPTVCASSLTCSVLNPYYYQCLTA